MNIYVDGYLIKTNPSDVGGITVNISGKNESLQFNVKDFTNNQVEYLAVLFGALKAKNNDVIISDSQLVVKTIGENWKTDINPLAILCELCKYFIKKKKLSLIWRSREENLAGHYNDSLFKQANNLFKN